MGDDGRGWQLVGAAVYVGVFVVPILGIVLYTFSLFQEIATITADSSTAEPLLGYRLSRGAFVVALTLAVPGLAVALYRDASAVTSPEWDPDPRLYGLLGGLYPLSLVVAAVYLYRRYHRVGIAHLPVKDSLPAERVRDSRWWYAIAGGAALFVVGFGNLFVPYGAVLGFASALYLRVSVSVLVCVTGLILSSVGLTLDISAVRHSDGEWRPETTKYHLPTILVPGLVPLVAGFYLFNRHRHLGVP